MFLIHSRFCCDQRPNVTVTSESNGMMIVFRSNYSAASPYFTRGFQAIVRTDGKLNHGHSTVSNNRTCHQKWIMLGIEIICIMWTRAVGLNIVLSGLIPRYYILEFGSMKIQIIVYIVKLIWFIKQKFYGINKFPASCHFTQPRSHVSKRDVSPPGGGGGVDKQQSLHI